MTATTARARVCAEVAAVLVSGSFTVRVVTRNSAGADRFSATATRVGESCRAAGTF